MRRWSYFWHDFLTNHYSGERRFDRSIYYSNAHGLAGFFEFILHNLLVDGIAIYAIEWDGVEVNGSTITVPTSFSSVNPATVSVSKTKSGYTGKQRFSWLAKKGVSFYQYQDTNFKTGDLFVCTHPTRGDDYPVKVSLKHLRDLHSWTESGLWVGKTNAEPESHSLLVERARHIKLEEYRDKQLLARLKVRRIFNLATFDLELEQTEYYQVFTYKEWKKNLNNIRDYLISQFNHQVIDYMVQKNEGDMGNPVLEYGGFISNESIDGLFDKYVGGEITGQELIDSTKDPYDQDIFPEG